MHAFRRTRLLAPFALALALPFVFAFAGPARADSSSWPRQFESSGGAFVLYQPQPEELRGEQLTARAAFSVQKSGAANPVFGVLWFQARAEIDRDSSTVMLHSLDVTRVRLPGASEVEEGQYEKQVESEARQWDLSGSLDELQSGLAASAKERASIENLENTPPRIVFTTERSLLVTYDGDPMLEAIDGSSLQRVSNTPYAVVYDPDARRYYLDGGNLWYRAEDPLGPWSPIASPPQAVADVVPPDTSRGDELSGPPPRIVTATVPTELVQTDGDPLLAPLVGDQLLYVTNTESDVLRLVDTQAIYVLLAGRWYTAKSQDGPWKYVPSDQLPEVFWKIPPDSPKGALLASVAGTDEADDALADNEIPQTTAIQRGSHDVIIAWDGDPQFEAIPGTQMQYGVNTDAEVLFEAGRYYLCDQGVWYVGDNAFGPWDVCGALPDDIDDLPPSCPIYNVRYVCIYDVEPEVVYVGYLPGYLGYYPCRGTVVYGTGYRYKPWRGRRHYYPRPVTWGFHACYNPWLGRWSFGFSYWSGFLRTGLRWRPLLSAGHPRRMPLWIGPGGFHRPLLAANLSMLRVMPAREKLRRDDPTPQNIYRRSENAQRNARPGVHVPVREIGAIGRIAPVPNDVFAGRDGNVYQRGQRGQWKVNQNRQWTPTPMPSAPPIPVQPVDASDAARMRREAQRPRTQPVPVAPTPAAEEGGGQKPQPATPVRTPTPAPAPVQRVTSPAPFGSAGGLERDFRARQRASGTPPVAHVSSPPPRAPERQKEQPRKSSEGERKRQR